jgi:hypothetical protein
MSNPETFIRYSLRNRLFVLAGATFVLCAVVILLFFPLLNLTLKSMQEGQEVEATTIARLLVMEFSSLKGLFQVTPTSDNGMDQRIKDLLWEKVTFNEIIEGMELIQGQPDGLGRHLTYLFYRRDAPELKPMAGPQKILKTFEGLEQDLVTSINQQQRVDNNLLESVNRGPKKEGQMLLRYMPVYVLEADEGAIYWGIAKIGINTSRMRHLLYLQSEEQDRIRRDIWVEVVLSLSISGVLAMSLIYFWVRHITEPLKDLSAVAGDLRTARTEEFDLWLENLKRVDPQGQAEVAAIQEVLARVGAAVPRLGQRLIEGEARACLGQVIARGLPVFQTWQQEIRRREGQLADRGTGDLATRHQDLAALRTRCDTWWDDFAQVWSPPETRWAQVEVAPLVQRAWRLGTMGLTILVDSPVELPALPPVWGSAPALTLALLYLLVFAGELLPPQGDLGLAGERTPRGGVRLIVWMSGSPRSREECLGWLQPFGEGAAIQGSLKPALAAAIAAQHGGSLTVAPREPGGARFCLELPPSGAQESHESLR